MNETFEMILSGQNLVLEGSAPYIHANSDPARDLFHTWFLGVRMVQQWTDLFVWEQFLNVHPEIRRVVEFGTAQGGFSMFMALQCQYRGMDFRTLDRYASETLETPAGKALLKGKFMLADLFGPDRAAVEWLIRDPVVHPLCLFCDDGDKPRELKEYVPLLLPGDFVACHDWGTEVAAPDLAGLPVVDIFVAESEALLARTRFFQRV